MTDGYPGHELEALAQAPNYYRWIIHHFGPWLRGTVLEVGAGLGTFSAQVLAERPPERMVLVEPDAALLERLRGRFAGDRRIEILAGTLDAVPVEPVDAAVMVNVLEHIEDDRGTLSDLHRRLRPGGAAMIFVPALPALYGSLDAAFQHYRRYQRRELGGKLADAGFDVARLRYVNMPGILNWLLAGKVLRMQTIRPGAMRTYDRLIVPLARLLEDRIAPPVGQNLLAVGIKRRGTSA